MSNRQNPTRLPIELSILPGEHNGETIALTNTIGREIFSHVSAEHYKIEPVDTGTLGAGEFLILLFVLATQAAQILGQGVADKLGEKVIDQVTHLLKRIAGRIKTSEHKDVPSSLVVKLSDDYQIEVRGPLGVIIGDAAHALEEQKAQHRTNSKNNDILLNRSHKKKIVLTIYFPEE